MWLIFECIFLLRHRRRNGGSMNVCKRCTTICYVRIEPLGLVKIVDYVSVAEGSKLFPERGRIIAEIMGVIA